MQQFNPAGLPARKLSHCVLPRCPMTETSKPIAHATTLRGAVRLATDATAGLTDLVEAMHERIGRLPGVKPPAQAERTRGIAGLVYKSVRGVTRIVGGSLDALLGVLGPTLGSSTPGPEREAIVAALNGVLGDYLAATGNPLATATMLRTAGPASGCVVVLAHGLCMNDLQWQQAGHDHGAALQRDLGFTPVYLRYNSGQHVSVNARAFAAALEQLLARWPVPVQRLVLLGHSMGGLVMRSALHQAQQSGHQWPAQLTDMVFLGTPHHGAPLERAGNWVDIVLGATPYAAPFARLGKVRSAGITDLRHGNLLDEDWVGRDRFARGVDRRQPVPLPARVRCFTVAATLGARGGDTRDRLLGDGLVPLASALGQHADPARALAFRPTRQKVFHGMGHLALLGRPEVYQQLRRWLG